MANLSEFEFHEIAQICQSQDDIKSAGIFFGDNLLLSTTPILFVQLSLASLLTATFQLFLNPLGESAFFSQMLTCIVMGPTFWGENSRIMNAIYPENVTYINKTLTFFGCTLFVFLVGVRTDLGMVKRTGKKGFIVGIVSFLLPTTLNIIVASVIKKNVNLNQELHQSIFFIATFFASNSFHVIVCVLADLNLLNSELGRLAISASMISGMLSWFWVTVTYTIMQGSIGKAENVIWMFISLSCLVMIIVYILRPVMLMIVRHTGDAKSIKEGHILVVFLMVLGCLFVSEFIGQHMIIGPMFLGMATPEGPPLGSELVNKLDSYISSILIPGYFAITGHQINILKVKPQSVVVIGFMSLANFVGKVSAAVLPALYCNMTVVDAFSLGLIMSVQGITDVLVLQQALHLRVVDHELFTIMSLALVLMAGFTTPIVKFLYKPSKRYISHWKRTIQHAEEEAELRILAGIYSQYQTPSIINLLNLSNPTPKNPICFYVVYLQELIGRSAPLLVAHRPDRKSSVIVKGSQNMINAFRLYEESNEGAVVVNLFTAVSPYVTMHDEICSLASEKRVSLVIIPFHKQWNSSTQVEELPGPIRLVNQQILQNAPCSVGILVDRGTLSGISSKGLYNIGVIFVEGPDDREALAYAMRMGGNPNIKITVTRLVDSNKKTRQVTLNQELDEQIIDDFKIAYVAGGRKDHVFKEELVCDSVETVGVTRSMENSYDLILVGRRHDNNSPMFMGLTEWNEFPELGFFGDMLTSSDSGCQVSVLVMQQQSTLSEPINIIKGRSNYTLQDEDYSSIAVDVPRKFNRVCPEN